MSYAINGYKGIHSLQYTQAVAKKLEAAVKEGTRRGKADFDLMQQKIKDTLADMKKTLENGGKFW